MPRKKDKFSLSCCKICNRFKTTDGDFVILNTHERAIMFLHISEIEMVMTLCPDCDEIPHFTRRGSR